uniref:DUF148 domain-containing protein n=1 Tax=Globodera pallida TaxID=36090 RepID=A0A183CC58_GLOPA
MVALKRWQTSGKPSRSKEFASGKVAKGVKSMSVLVAAAWAFGRFFPLKCKTEDNSGEKKDDNEGELNVQTFSETESLGQREAIGRVSIVRTCIKIGKRIVGQRSSGFGTTFAALFIVMLFSGCCGQESMPNDGVNTSPALDRAGLEKSIQNKLSSENWYSSYLAIGIVIVVAKVTTIETDIKGMETKLVADMASFKKETIAANKAGVEKLKNEILRAMAPLTTEMVLVEKRVAANEKETRSGFQLVNDEIKVFKDAFGELKITMTAIQNMLEKRK